MSDLQHPFFESECTLKDGLRRIDDGKSVAMRFVHSDFVERFLQTAAEIGLVVEHHHVEASKEGTEAREGGTVNDIPNYHLFTRVKIADLIETQGPLYPIRSITDVLLRLDSMRPGEQLLIAEECGPAHLGWLAREAALKGIRFQEQDHGEGMVLITLLPHGSGPYTPPEPKARGGIVESVRRVTKRLTNIFSKK